MLAVEELKLVQRFPKEFIIHGNQTEAILQIRNAVSVNAARWLGEQLLRPGPGRRPRRRHQPASRCPLTKVSDGRTRPCPS
jgi:hypothetical protein